MVLRTDILFSAHLIKVLFQMTKMENEKVHILHVMLWEFKQSNSANVTAEKIHSMLKD